MNEYNSQTESFSDEQLTDPEGEPPEPSLRVLIANEQSSLVIDEAQLRTAVELVFRDSPYNAGAVSIAVVDDPTIHDINRQYLQHDYPTDVLSFVLEDRVPHLEGELVVSTDTASSNAADLDWLAHDELVLYVIHGALHLVGYRDKQPEQIREMRAAEKMCLHKLGIELPSDDSRWADQDTGSEARPS